VALVSGGLDSVVSLAQATESMDVRVVLFFDYGQRALDRERRAVMGVVNYYGLPVREVDIRWLADLAPPEMTQAASGSPAALNSIDAVWVPNRNGVFLNVGAAFAESYQCEVVVTGFNRDEAEEFPDNRAEYAERVNIALEMSTRNAVEVMSYTQDLGKREILELGSRLGAPLEVIWSCYHAGDLMCGRCTSCRHLRTALAGIDAADRPLIAFDSEGS